MTPPAPAGPAQSAAVRWLIQQVAAAGVSHVVVAPGSRSTPLVQAAAEQPGWQLTAVSDERSAAFVALGLARSGQLPLVITTSGSAVAHVLPACIEAHESSLPLILLTADRPDWLQGVGAPQTIAQRGLLQSHALTLHIEACDPDWMVNFATVSAKMSQAVATMQRQGRPLHLNVGLHTPLALVDADPSALLPQRGSADAAPGQLTPGPLVPPPVAGEKVAVIAGPLLPRDTHPDLRDFMDGRALLLAEWPSQLAGDRDAPDVPLRLFDLWLRDPQWRARCMPARIVRLGEWPASKGLQLLLEDAAARGVPVDAVCPGRRSDPLHSNALETFLSPRDALARWPMAPQADAQVADWISDLRSAEIAVRAALQTVAGPPELLAVRQVARALCPGDQLILGNSMAVRDADGFCLDVPGGVTVHTARGANGIDGTIAASLGIAWGSGRRCLTYLGDGALLHDVGALQLLAQRKVSARLDIVCIDNGGGAIFDFLPARAVVDASVHERFFYAAHGLDLLQIARGFGLDATRLEDATQLGAWLQQPAVGVRVAILAVDRQQSMAARRAWQAAGLASLEVGR